MKRISATSSMFELMLSSTHAQFPTHRKGDTWSSKTRNASPLTHKGVLCNEMKGVHSSPDGLLNREPQRSVFPNDTHAMDSGDPHVIPDLSFEQFTEFHSKFCHCTISQIVFSGKDDVHKRFELAVVDKNLSDCNETPEGRENVHPHGSGTGAKPGIWSLRTSRESHMEQLLWNRGLSG